jgi:hypothetical protein
MQIAYVDAGGGLKLQPPILIGTCESGEFLNDLDPCFLSGRIKISVGLAGMGKMRFQFQH